MKSKKADFEAGLSFPHITRGRGAALTQSKVKILKGSKGKGVLRGCVLNANGRRLNLVLASGRREDHRVLYVGETKL